MPVCDPFRQDFRQYLIQQFYEKFKVLSDDVFFLGIGKNTEWTDSSGLNSDAAPPKNVDCVRSDTDFWRTAFAFKKIEPENVSIVVKRNDWQPNTVYSAYRDDIDLYDDTNPANFYILVDEERVYKCIDNNYDAASTVAPTHTDSQIRTLSDGYRWKYLYTIPESKRKFLTKTQGSSLGYMPVEYVSRVNENDDRQLQYDVQLDAVDGSIDFIDLNETLREHVISDRVLFYSASNQVAGSTGAGATAVTIGGSQLVYENDYYNNMTIRFEQGAGRGQQRRIVDYINNGNSTATVVLQSPLDYGISGGASPTYYSILPTVIVSGDGTAATDTLHTSATAAEIHVSFLSITAGGSTGQRYLDRFEMVNSGQDYTYATVAVVAGLTFESGYTADISSLATAVLSPIGGHGSNAVKELGASSIMIVTEFEQSEQCKITTENDFRQFALIKNPLLAEKWVRLFLAGAGLTSSFLTGNSATQALTGSGGVTGYDPAQGTIIDWVVGTTGYTGTSELVLSSITGGDFALGGRIAGLTTQEIVGLSERTVAGTEYRRLMRLKLSPVSGTFDPSGFDFVIGNLAIGRSNTGDNIWGTNSNGKIYNWEPENGTNTVGNLYLEYPNGPFKVGEYVYQVKNDLSGLTGPKGKVIEVDEFYDADRTVYDQTYRIKINYDGTTIFDDESFAKDDHIGVAGASGYVMDWTPATGSTFGYLRILPSFGTFETGQTLLYTNSDATGGEISQIIGSPEMRYRSGEVMHLQNIRPVDRSPEQKEEIKLIVEF
jgi:hypothetical protein